MEDEEDLLGLNADEAETHESDTEEAPEAEAEASADTEERARDDKGRFIPVSALTGLRKDLETKFEREARELREEIARLKGAQQQPQGEQRQFTPEQEREFQAQSERLDMYEELARDRFGDEVIDEAQKWFQGLAASDPVRVNAIQSARNPYKALIEHFKSDLEREELEELRSQGFDASDPDGWVLQRAQQIMAERRSAASQQPTSQTAPPPRSLVGAPSSGGGAGTVRSGPGTAFDDVFS
jgi:hypothetical protein